VSPEAAEGGTIGLVQENDVIEINIPERRIHLCVDENELARRRALQNQRGWQPEKPRKRNVSPALKAYASMTTSAAHGAVGRI
jgi:dihydroxy-acid dehydratase